MNQNQHNEAGISHLSTSFPQKLGYDFSTQKKVSKVEQEQSILMSSNPTDSSKSPESGGLNAILTYGGVPVAVIIAMAYFSQIQLKSITELLKTVNKKTK
ncbi:hypothetical protein NDI37_07405 [Funiculus sociatus GB2-A5]|uniref:Uncharacterized protein n=1 Tax=Funiculus sociatus GB2-A5 TaxID=2933946 RepID=A0ABV0JLH6_9CYAN|nr:MULTISPECIES: hypothetical protein [unclassified Trichocoleus]MBD1908330.1 hypothetical protein [Trichocoleus sp. FACHB-832]MBD2065573.1 hypothetical protein [Trichocoleus sp. FACHB-6]